ncbi:MAG: UDP-2,3-diacylglucosamine diphosphatase LpxI [Candidatus Goldbacteria bacterium]|nr:UDP-2,3-diacylglucosamine diphosphatase LpxI [Candidatus Goldiibacteriota bacterium]
MKSGKVGLLAGRGELPVRFLRKARENKIDVVLMKIKGESDDKLSKLAYKSYDVKLTALSDIIKICKKESVTRIIMLGYVGHSNLINKIKFDLRTLKILLKIKDRRASSVLKGAINELKNEGIEVIDSRFLMSDLLAGSGYLTKKRPVKKYFDDVVFGRNIAKKISNADIGQTVVIKNKVVIAVEALEGTDECIKRGAKLAGPGFVVVKVSRPEQDMRFDIPVIGLKTVTLLRKCKAAGIAIEAGKTFLLNRDKLISVADENNIFVYGMK